MVTQVNSKIAILRQDLVHSRRFSSFSAHFPCKEKGFLFSSFLDDLHLRGSRCLRLPGMPLLLQEKAQSRSPPPPPRCLPSPNLPSKTTFLTPRFSVEKRGTHGMGFDNDLSLSQPYLGTLSCSHNHICTVFFSLPLFSLLSFKVQHISYYNLW